MNTNGFLHCWGNRPLAIYVAGILLPVLVASLRAELMSVLGVLVYTVLFWTGPFASAAVVFWSSWSAVWRIVWVVLIPAFVAASFLPLLI